METAGFYPAEEIGIARRLCVAQSSIAILAVYVTYNASMKATVTLKIKLETTEHAAQSLSETQQAYLVALNQTSGVAFDKKIFNSVALHHITYRDVRELTKLPANLVCSARNLVAEAYKRDKQTHHRWKETAAFLSIKVDRHRICAAYENSNALLRLGAVSAGKQRRERRGPARLGDDSQHLPKGFLRLPNLTVCNQHGAAHVFFRDREHQGADATGGERVRRDTARFGVDRFSGFKRSMKCGRGLRLDADDLDPAAIPRGDAAN